MMEPRIETLPETKLVGRRRRMTYAANATQELWQSFMPHVKAIHNTVGSALYSVEVYDDTTFFERFDPKKAFVKWAAIQVTGIDAVPVDLEALSIPSGLYAVFHYKGKASDAPEAYRYIFGTWMPPSGYALDDRPHLAVMGEKYRHEHPDSEEEIWIPIRKE